MTKTLVPLSVIALALLAFGCSVESMNPAAALSESEPIPEPWLGVWDATEILGEAARVPFSIEVSNNADGSARLLVREGRRATVENASVLEVGGVHVASIPSEHGGWSLFALEIDGAEETMTIRSLDAAVVKADIVAGIVSGEVIQIGFDDEIVRLTAPSTELRSYLGSRPAAFGAEVLATLQKRMAS